DHLAGMDVEIDVPQDGDGLAARREFAPQVPDLDDRLAHLEPHIGGGPPVIGPPPTRSPPPRENGFAPVPAPLVSPEPEETTTCSPSARPDRTSALTLSLRPTSMTRGSAVPAAAFQTS